MLSPQQAAQLDIPQPSANQLTQHSFEDPHALWQKGTHGPIPQQAVEKAKRYPYHKLGKILGIETYRYLCIHERFLFYFEEA